MLAYDRIAEDATSVSQLDSVTDMFSAAENLAGGGVSTDASRVVWCAVQVREGHERAMAHRIERVCGSSAVADTFVLKRELPFKQNGAWGTRVDVLFPGYVLVCTPDTALLKTQLNLITEFHHLVCVGEVPAILSAAEVELIRLLGGSGRMVTTSLGEIVDGMLHVTYGPLKGNESLIAKIDRHKRIAYLNTDSFSWTGSGEGARRMPKVGLEVVSKS